MTAAQSVLCLQIIVFKNLYIIVKNENLISCSEFIRFIYLLLKIILLYIGFFMTLLIIKSDIELDYYGNED